MPSYEVRVKFAGEGFSERIIRINDAPSREAAEYAAVEEYKKHIIVSRPAREVKS